MKILKNCDSGPLKSSGFGRSSTRVHVWQLSTLPMGMRDERMGLLRELWEKEKNKQDRVPYSGKILQGLMFAIFVISRNFPSQIFSTHHYNYMQTS